MSTIITKYGMPNIDFADVKAAMKGQGTAIFGIGVASGENRAVDAASKAINNPLLEDTSIDGAKHFLINICASSDFSLTEMEDISKIICASASPNYELKPGIVTDESMGDSISVTVIATGFNSGNEPEEVKETVEVPVQKEVKKENNTYSPDEFEKLLSGGASLDTPNFFEQEDETEADDSGYSEKEEFSSDPRSDWKKRAGNVDMNDMQTPAALRHKSGYSRTINFNRNK